MGKISFFRCVTCGKKYEPTTLYGICKACGSIVERNITMFKDFSSLSTIIKP